MTLKLEAYLPAKHSAGVSGKIRRNSQKIKFAWTLIFLKVKILKK